MDVLFTVPRFWPEVTGPTRAVAALANGLAARGDTVTIVAPGNASPPPDLSPRIRLARLATDRVPWVRPPRGLRSLLEGARPDAVVCHEAHNGLTRAVLPWALRRGARVGLQPHGGLTAPRHLPRRLARVPYALYDRVLGGAARTEGVTLIASCQGEEADLSRAGWPAARIVRLYLGSDFPRRRAFRPAVVPRILMVGNLGGFRDPRVLAEAAERVRARGAALDLRLVGALRSPSVFLRRPTADALRRLGYTGPGNDSALAAEYAAADLFAYPSRYESFGLPLLEAARTGLPIVSTPVGIAPELRVEDSGRVAASLAPEPFADALQGALEDLSGCTRRAARRAARLAKWTSWAARADAYRAWLREGRPRQEPSLASVLDDGRPRGKG